jgi:hypothetical protein
MDRIHEFSHVESMMWFAKWPHATREELDGTMNPPHRRHISSHYLQGVHDEISIGKPAWLKSGRTGNKRMAADGATNQPALAAKSLRFCKISLRRRQISLRGVGCAASRATNVRKVNY